MPQWLEAALWGLLAGSGLILGAAAGYFLPVPRKLVAMVMAFGSGILLSALAFELLEEAYERDGMVSISIGFLAGAMVFTAANWLLSRKGAAERKEPGEEQPSEAEAPGSGAALAIGALIDGIPEGIVIGLSLLPGGAVSYVAIGAVFLSNVPEALGGASGMKHAGRPLSYVFGVWGGVALATALSALIGYAVFQAFPEPVIAATTAVAAGGILAMLVDTMIPEAFEVVRNYSGLLAVLGFLVSFMLSKLAG